MLCAARTLRLCFVLLLLPLSAFSQGPIAPSRPQVDLNRTYPKSPAGLRWQLQDIWNAARDGNPARLESLIKLTEIPDPNWFARIFGQEKGARWGEAYAKDLAGSEKDMEDLMTRLAGEDGEFWVRNINYEPAPAREVERALIDSLRQPVEIFFASWRKRDSEAISKSTPVGYFVFIDGRFRWDSAIVPADVQFVPHQDEKPPQSSAAGNAPAQSARASGRQRSHGIPARRRRSRLPSVHLLPLSRIFEDGSQKAPPGNSPDAGNRSAGRDRYGSHDREIARRGTVQHGRSRR